MSRVVYNIYFHSLARFPGSRSWSATRLTFVHALYRGSLVHDVQKMHEKYGSIVRIASSEISITDPMAWRDIYTDRPGHQAFPKNPVWWHRRNGEVDTIMNADDAEHSRLRRLFAHEFSEKALKAQEPRIQSHIDMLVRRLRELSIRGENVQDIMHWYNCTTFDIISDLALGESFRCLDQNRPHPWVKIISSQFKAAAFISSLRFFAPLRFYSLLESLLMMCLPRNAVQQKKDHARMTRDKVGHRLQRGQVLRIMYPTF